MAGAAYGKGRVGGDGEPCVPQRVAIWQLHADHQLLWHLTSSSMAFTGDSLAGIVLGDFSLPPNLLSNVKS